MTENGGGLPNRAHFSKQVGRTFRAAGPDGTEFELTLTECSEIVDNDTQETFSLLFLAPAGTAPAQMTYTLVNDEMGPIDVFLVPASSVGNGLYFEAIFNLLKSSGAGVTHEQGQPT